jgi:hypothetical protein
MTKPAEDDLTIDDFDFEVALSFAGDNKREKIREIANQLKAKLGDDKVFFDEDYEDEFAGPDADIYFQEVYGQKTRLVVACVCTRYNEKVATRTEWRAIRDFFTKHRDDPIGKFRFLPIRFNDGEVDGLFPNIDHIPYVGEQDVDRIIDFILRRHQRCLGKKSITQDGKGEISAQAISALIGKIRHHESDRLLSLARIAYALLKNMLIPDMQPTSAGSHPIASLVRSLINDPIASGGEPHPAIRFCVLLSELCSSLPELQKSLREWFGNHCAPAGYNYDAVLGELPDLPDQSKRFLWLDVHWSEMTPGESASVATAYLRCGHLQYRVADEHSRLPEQVQFAKVVRIYNESQQRECPVNHVAAVIKRSKMIDAWDIDPETNDPLPLPVTVREENNNGALNCPKHLDDNTNANWDTEESLALRTQNLGVFVTGRIAATAIGFPCKVFNALLNCTTIGIWTRGPCETDDDDRTLRDHSHVLDLCELPRLIHTRRTGAIDVHSIWRRVVLYFSPNIPPLARDTDTLVDIQQVNSQLY